MDLQELSDDGLMTRVRLGDARAFEGLYTRYAQPIFAFLWRSTGGDAELAADIRQEIFLQLWNARDHWRSGGSLSAYLFRAARGRLADQRRRAAVRERDRPVVAELQAAPPTPDELFRVRELAARVASALDALPERTREVFSLKWDAGLRYREIAELLGVSVKTVEYHMSRALSLLAESLEDLRPAGDG